MRTKEFQERKSELVNAARTFYQHCRQTMFIGESLYDTEHYLHSVEACTLRQAYELVTEMWGNEMWVKYVKPPSNRF